MASNKNALAMCDTCGFVYPHRVMKLNSYRMVTCPTCWEGAYDFKNHPQNKSSLNKSILYFSKKVMIENVQYQIRKFQIFPKLIF